MFLSLLLLLAPAHAQLCPGLEAELEALDGGQRCLTMPLRHAWSRAGELGVEACLGEELAARGLPAFAPPAVSTARIVTPPAPPAEKQISDSYDLPNMEESVNFVAWWGTDASVQRNDVEDLLDAFEDGWDYEVEGMGLPGPEGSETTKINIYIGDSGSGAPSSHGAAGYFTYDSQGRVLICVAASSLYDPHWAAATAVHELFHAVQAATGTFADYDYRWIWEATAVWIEGQVYPKNMAYAGFLFGFAYLPWLPLDFYDYPDSGALEEYYQYGAFIFPRYLSEVAYDEDFVRDAWLVGGPFDDPLEVFDSLAAERGGDLLTDWADFNAHNVAWDYQDGSVYEAVLNGSDGYWDNLWIAASHHGLGTEEWQSPTQRLPQRYGVNNIELRYPSDGTLHVELELDPSGNAGSGAQWVVTLVRRGYELSYEPLEVVDGFVEHVVEGIGDETVIWLTVGATSERRVGGESFAYSYRIWIEELEDTSPPEDTGSGQEEPGGCGCSGSGSGAAWSALLALIALAGLRRRGVGREPVGQHTQA
jgi:MYXO-CTERM domain-containing protein